MIPVQATWRSCRLRRVCVIAVAGNFDTPFVSYLGIPTDALFAR